MTDEYLQELLIEADGVVRFKHLPPELLELAIELDPSNTALHERRALYEEMEE